MRDILFKAKRLDNGEWVEGYYAKRHGVPYIYENRDCPQSIYEIDADTICQYTGLTDKNGKKIWENDIISFVLETEQGKTELIKKVKYRRNGRISPFWWEFECHGCGAYNEIKEVAVLGNIFDNPELLKGGE